MIVEVLKQIPGGYDIWRWYDVRLKCTLDGKISKWSVLEHEIPGQLMLEYKRKKEEKKKNRNAAKGQKLITGNLFKDKC